MSQASLQITPDTVVVNINRNTIDANRKQQTNEPPIRVSKGKRGEPEYGHEVAVLGPDGSEVARFIYDPHNKIVSCGARLVLVAHHGARVIS